MDYLFEESGRFSSTATGLDDQVDPHHYLVVAGDLGHHLNNGITGQNFSFRSGRTGNHLSQ